MRRLATIVLLGLGFFACQTIGIPPGGAETVDEEFRRDCASYGLKPGTQEFANCLSHERMIRQITGRPPGLIWMADCKRPDGSIWVMHRDKCTETGGRIIRR